MQVGEEDLPVAQHSAFGRLWFLHLDDHLRPVEPLLRAAGDFGAGRPIVVVRASDSSARLGFNNDLVCVMNSRTLSGVSWCR